MRQLAKVVTGSVMLAVSPWAGPGAGLAQGGSFEDALGAITPGIMVQASKAEPFSQVESGHVHLATDTHDALVDDVVIDDRLLAEGLVHSTLEGPMGPDDPSITGVIRFRPRPAARPAVLPTAAMQPAGEAAEPCEPDAAVTLDEPALITDRVSEAEAIHPPAGWADGLNAAFSRLLKRQP